MASVGYPHISLDSANVPVLTGTRIKVVEIVLDHLAHGADAEEIQRQFSFLTLGQIHSALAYYYDHQEELDQDIDRRLRKVGEIQPRLGNSPLPAGSKGSRTSREPAALHGPPRSRRSPEGARLDSPGRSPGGRRPQCLESPERA